LATKREEIKARFGTGKNLNVFSARAVIKQQNDKDVFKRMVL
jgi:hypothetical protein